MRRRLRLSGRPTDGVGCWPSEGGDSCMFSFECLPETEYCSAARLCAERLEEGAACDLADSADQCISPLSCRESDDGSVCAP